MSSASAAAARTRRTTTAARVKPSAPAAAPAVSAIGTETPSRPDTVVTERELSHEEIARMAYTFWEARGGQGGSAEEDWKRAEQRLRALATSEV